MWFNGNSSIFLLIASPLVWLKNPWKALSWNVEGFELQTCTALQIVSDKGRKRFYYRLLLQTEQYVARNLPFFAEPEYVYSF